MDALPELFIKCVQKLNNKQYEERRCKPMKDMQWVVLVNGEEKAIFKNEIDALQYKDWIKNINRMAGYKDNFEIKKISR